MTPPHTLSRQLYREGEEVRLFLGSLGGNGVVVGLGERLRLALLAVLLSQCPVSPC